MIGIRRRPVWVLYQAELGGRDVAVPGRHPGFQMRAGFGRVRPRRLSNPSHLLRNADDLSLQ
jgi:hypothetical protein